MLADIARYILGDIIEYTPHLSIIYWGNYWVSINEDANIFIKAEIKYDLRYNMIGY